MAFEALDIPAAGARITKQDGKLHIPDQPIIPYILGDGIGVDVTPVMRKVLDAAVEKAYGGSKGIAPSGSLCRPAAVAISSSKRITCWATLSLPWPL